MNVITATDLRFPHLRPSVGWPTSLHHTPRARFDPLRYVAWVPGRVGTEQAPRTALHLVECRNGQVGGS